MLRCNSRFTLRVSRPAIYQTPGCGLKFPQLAGPTRVLTDTLRGWSATPIEIEREQLPVPTLSSPAAAAGEDRVVVSPALMVLMVRRPKKGSVAAAGAGAPPRGNAPRAEVVEQGTCHPPSLRASLRAAAKQPAKQSLHYLPDQRGLPRPYGPRNDGR
jgi:hypothetical protein